jgi:CheY-like chemotaxis protein
MLRISKRPTLSATDERAGRTDAFKVPMRTPGLLAAFSQVGLRSREDGDLGEGSRFIGGQQPAVRSPPTLQRVLIVEDDPAIAESIGAVLERFGHRWRRAENGLRALELAATFQPQVVRLDLGIPDGTGLKVARLLRTGPGGADLFIAAITGGDQASRDRAVAAGIDRHLQKPVAIEAILTVMLDAALRQSHRRLHPLGPAR